MAKCSTIDCPRCGARLRLEADAPVPERNPLREAMTRRATEYWGGPI